MNISVQSNQVSIVGNVKSIAHFQEIKTTLDSLSQSSKNITIILVDSISLTSSVIGYFNKLILRDKIDLQIKFGDAQLMNLLDDLFLTKTFKATKV